MMDLIRRLKIAYSAYNFFHKNELIHNEPLFKKLGLKKKYYSSISSKDFKGLDNILATLPNSISSLTDLPLYQSISQEDKTSLEDFDEKGYSIIRNYLSPDAVDRINEEVKTLLDTGKVRVGYGGKIMFAIHVSPLLRKISENKGLNALLSALLRGKAVQFQSINFTRGSEQASHSDSIHMTTYPLGGLLGVWIALEDIDEENGPLHYYPGSHKLPYYLNADYDNEGNTWLIGNKSYSAYENMMRQKIKDLGLKKEVFKARKGDLLIWHANLFHGGEAHVNKDRTRKSMVFHYFKEHAICYHEITQRPALIKRFS